MKRLAGAVLIACLALGSPALADSVRVKDIGRFLGWQDNALVGYGIVTGLAGSGDSPRSMATRQALSNVLSHLGANIAASDLQSRNVAAVVVTATLPPSANIGNKIDVTVTSMGDARSLAGGTLLMAPLLGPDHRDYALAQGALVVGGYNFRDEFNQSQANYPTSGVITGGATVEAAVDAKLLDANRYLTFVLRDPDFTTAQRIADNLNTELGYGAATVRGADAVMINTNPAKMELSRLISRIENVEVSPDESARVVVNERSGTIVAGGGVRISSVVIAQGDIKVSISPDNDAAQPYLYDGYGRHEKNPIVTKLEVSDASDDAVVRLPNASVADLVRALNEAKVSTRRTIAVLQAIKAAGALHADIIVQ